jgi:hypothetical protein
VIAFAVAAVATALALSGGTFGSQHSAGHSIRTIDRVSI